MYVVICKQAENVVSDDASAVNKNVDLASLFGYFIDCLLAAFGIANINPFGFDSAGGFGSATEVSCCCQCFIGGCFIVAIEECDIGSLGRQRKHN